MTSPRSPCSTSFRRTESPVLPVVRTPSRGVCMFPLAKNPVRRTSVPYVSRSEAYTTTHIEAASAAMGSYNGVAPKTSLANRNYPYLRDDRSWIGGPGGVSTSGNIGMSPSSSSRSLYQSPIHSRSSSLTSIKSSNAPRDRSVDRVDRTLNQMTGDGANGRVESSRERCVNDRYFSSPMSNCGSGTHAHPVHNVLSASHFYPDGSTHCRERGNLSASLHMAMRNVCPNPNLAATLNSSNLVRSQSVDHQFISRLASFYPSPPVTKMKPTRDVLILDLQSQIANLNHECWVLNQELDRTREKLCSSMNSVKTFWSPELKRERALRKEDAVKLSILSEQLTTILHAANTVS